MTIHRSKTPPVDQGSARRSSQPNPSIHPAPASASAPAQYTDPEISADSAADTGTTTTNTDALRVRCESRSIGEGGFVSRRVDVVSIGNNVSGVDGDGSSGGGGEAEIAVVAYTVVVDPSVTNSNSSNNNNNGSDQIESTDHHVVNIPQSELQAFFNEPLPHLTPETDEVEIYNSYNPYVDSTGFGIDPNSSYNSQNTRQHHHHNSYHSNTLVGEDGAIQASVIETYPLFTQQDYSNPSRYCVKLLLYVLFFPFVFLLYILPLSMKYVCCVRMPKFAGDCYIWFDEVFIVVTDAFVRGFNCVSNAVSSVCEAVSNTVTTVCNSMYFNVIAPIGMCGSRVIEMLYNGVMLPVYYGVCVPFFNCISNLCVSLQQNVDLLFSCICVTIGHMTNSIKFYILIPTHEFVIMPMWNALVYLLLSMYDIFRFLVTLFYKYLVYLITQLYSILTSVSYSLRTYILIPLYNVIVFLCGTAYDGASWACIGAYVWFIKPLANGFTWFCLASYETLGSLILYPVYNYIILPIYTLTALLFSTTYTCVTSTLNVLIYTFEGIAGVVWMNIVEPMGRGVRGVVESILTGVFGKRREDFEREQSSFHSSGSEF